MSHVIVAKSPSLREERRSEIVAPRGCDRQLPSILVQCGNAGLNRLRVRA